MNNLFLLAATATVFLGTFYPVFVEIAGGHSISVGRPYYELTFVPVAVPLLLLVSFGPMLNWKRNDTRRSAGAAALADHSGRGRTGCWACWPSALPRCWRQAAWRWACS